MMINKTKANVMLNPIDKLPQNSFVCLQVAIIKSSITKVRGQRIADSLSLNSALNLIHYSWSSYQTSPAANWSNERQLGSVTQQPQGQVISGMYSVWSLAENHQTLQCERWSPSMWDLAATHSLLTVQQILLFITFFRDVRSNLEVEPERPVSV